VFTSDQPIGQRSRGDWGGLIINGRAPINFGTGEAAGEGDTGVYGGNDPNDNSGILRYVRVEFGGIEFSPDNELNGIEADNNEFNNNVTPRSNPQIYNVTICGDPNGLASEVQRAANLRRGTAFTIRNFLITGMRQGFQIETTNTATTAQVDNGTSQMGAGVSWGNVSAANAMHSSVTTYTNSGRFPNVVLNQAAGISAAACNASNLNPALQPPLASLAGGQLAPIQPPNDGFFDAVTFIGAVPPAPTPNWMDGWTSFPQN
jgi:hypothetical protein